MTYTLMHKNAAVAELEIDEATSAIIKIGDVYAAERIPIGVGFMNGLPNRGLLNEWWTGRSIPASRSGLREALAKLNVSSPKFLLTKCYALSLSDHSSDKSLEWSEINFFENPFSEDVGNILFGGDPHGEFSLMSPDNTSDGWLKKKWIIKDGGRYLVKCGSGDWLQEPANEVIASAIMRRLGIPHAEYTLMIDSGEPISACEDFITPQTDLVSAWDICLTAKKPNDRSKYSHFINCCEMLGIPGAVESVDQMIALDYLIVNSDRHFNNFGAVRDVDTLEWLGIAPLFDSGTSLWHNTNFVGSDRECKPFRSKHDEQIKLVTSFDWLDFSALSDLDEEAPEIMVRSGKIGDARRDALLNALNKHIVTLEQIALEQTQNQRTTMTM